MRQRDYPQPITATTCGWKRRPNCSKARSGRLTLSLRLSASATPRTFTAYIKKYPGKRRGATENNATREILSRRGFNVKRLASRLKGTNFIEKDDCSRNRLFQVITFNFNEVKKGAFPFNKNFTFRASAVWKKY